MTIYKAIIFNAITECLGKGDYDTKYLLMILARTKSLVVNVKEEENFVNFLAAKGIKPKKSEHTFWCCDLKRYTMPEFAIPEEVA